MLEALPNYIQRSDPTTEYPGSNAEDSERYGVSLMPFASRVIAMVYESMPIFGLTP